MYSGTRTITRGDGNVQKVYYTVDHRNIIRYYIRAL